MNETEKETDLRPLDAAPDSPEGSVVQTIGRKVGSAVGAIAAKVSGSSPRRSANAYDVRRLEIKKKKRAAHRRKIKASHAKG